MAQNENENKSTLERGSYEDRGVLERGRPDGYGYPSENPPALPSKEKAQIPQDWPRTRK